MEDLILKIMDIEQQAQEFMKDAKKANAEFDNTLKNEESKMHDDIITETQNKCRDMAKKEEEVIRHKCETIDNDEKTKANKIKLKYERSKEEWVSRMFKNIIG